jgi:hypothetical protein
MKHRHLFVFGRALAAASMVACGGCSLLFVTPPQSSGKIQTGAPKQCTTSRAMPVLDTILTGFEVVRTGLAIGADASVYSDPNQPLSREADIALGIGFTALFLGSAVYGYSATARCDRGSPPEAAPDTQPTERWSGASEQPRKRAAVPRAAPTASAASAGPAEHEAEGSTTELGAQPVSPGASASPAGSAAPVGVPAAAPTGSATSAPPSALPVSPGKPQ